MTDHHDNAAEHEGAEHAPDEEPSTDELEEPSVAKEPGEEPKAPEKKDEEPSHRAVGIGVIDDEVPPVAP
ncbi:hypothetical protein [Microbacterium oleivorans]|uniref:Uncharacterized protein n=1 Tax=Microbacterium oleivorans TaxID=273677 RepID=A0A7D5IPU9_9MICO|nr:hypothetical protein [Microbacterium oleivorans]QLD11799.1 hypothetical protein HW566_08465 [Microbacterium oleivorans]